MDYALSSGGGGNTASTVLTTVITMGISNGVVSCRGNNGCNAIDVDNDPASDGATNTGARAPPPAPPPGARRIGSRHPNPPAGKWCSGTGGVGNDNPNNPLVLTDEQKAKAISFFFRDFSTFEVNDAARTAAHRVCHRQWHPAHRVS